MSKKKWRVSACDKELAARLAQELSLDPFAALIAVSRGIETAEQAQEFFDTGDMTLSDPYELLDMDKAVERISDAIDDFERIAVFGDYDADGVTATALLCSYLEMREADFFYLLPTRDEGYGLNCDMIDKLKSMGAKLIITVDNGINSVEEARYAASLGLDLVITDHHQAGDEIPVACAVVNPHRPDCTSRFKELAGVGVAFKLVCALEGDSEGMLEEYADLVTIGTVGDIIPLKGENRIIVRRGVEMINTAPRTGLCAMRDLSGAADKQMSATGIAFVIAPRLNAAGRMGSAHRALELLLCEDASRAAQLAQEIEDANLERQKTEQKIMELAQRQLEENPEMLDERVLVCDGENWHNGVIGIVASRMVEKYGKPCIIITRDGDTAKGSGRSLEGFSLYDALEHSSQCLLRFGGHVLAAGINLESSRIDEFRRTINEYARSQEMPFPVQRIDLKLKPKYISLELLEALELLEPFGAGNPQPVFGLYGMRIDTITPLSGGKHIRLAVTKNDTKLNVIRFGVSPEDFPFSTGSIVDLAVALGVNEYMGERRVGIYLKNVRYSAFSHDDYFEGLRAYDELKRGEKPTLCAERLVPDRAFVAEIYKKIKANGDGKRTADELCLATNNLGDGICPVLLSLDALCELGIVNQLENGRFELSNTQTRVNLEDSVVLKNARRVLS